MTADIRQLNKVDVAAFRALRLEALCANGEAFGATFDEENAHSDAWFTERIANNIIYGAFREGALVGIAAYFIQKGAKEAHKAYLWGVYVQPAHRQQGLARLLVTAATDHAQKHVEQIQLSVNSLQLQAKRLYESLGYVAYGHEKWALKHDGVYHDEIHMAKFFGA